MSALQLIFPVTFVARALGDWAGLDAALVVTDGEDLPPPPVDLPVLLSPLTAGVRRAGVVDLSSSASLDARLRGRRLREERAIGTAVEASGEPTEILASAETTPLWTRCSRGRGWLDSTALGLHQIPDGAPLRAHLRQGRFLALLPIIELLRAITHYQHWQRPPLQAAFVIDDPNLHSRRYGFIEYERLAAHAELHGYHAGIATIPLDAWLIGKRPAATFRRHPEAISLLVHGNDHIHHELGVRRSPADSATLIGQAEHRIRTLERRSGVSVARIMAPPHERLDDVSLRALFLGGFEGVTVSWHYPWRFRAGSDQSLAGWDRAELLGGGLPLFQREHLHDPDEDLVLRAYLDQPLIVYLHEIDLAEGLEPLAVAANRINTLGPIQWNRLDLLARSNYRWRREGDLARVRLCSRRAEFPVPPGVRAIRIETPPVHGTQDGLDLVVGGVPINTQRSPGGWQSTVIAVHGGDQLSVILGGKQTVSTQAAKSAVLPWPALRRALAEGRDRARAGLKLARR